MAFVLDASMTLAWYFPDEATQQTNALRERLIEEEVVVPTHWALEVTNALLTALRRNRLGADELDLLVVDLRQLAGEVDSHTQQRAWDKTLDIAGKYKLSAYDAAYLELAQRRALPLATLDARLRTACADAGVAVLPN